MEKKRVLLVATAESFAEALEDWIIDNQTNPTTPEEWERCITDLAKQGSLKPVGGITNVDKFKEKLKDDFNVERL